MSRERETERATRIEITRDHSDSPSPGRARPRSRPPPQRRPRSPPSSSTPPPVRSPPIARPQLAVPSSSSSSGSSSQSSVSEELKRLVVCCDGTWLDSDAGLLDGKITPPSNVTRMTRAIKPKGEDGVPQIVYYQAGIGSMGTEGNKLVGGITGDGLAEHVREGYSFIANNYEDGDEIFLLGFSRGAYTARAIAGLIDGLGVMTKAGLASFPIVYKDFSHRHDRRYRSPLPDKPFPDKPSAGDPEYARQLARRRLTSLGVRIKAIGVFDTVGSLGVPRIGWLGKFGQRLSDDTEYRFYDTALGNCIENAFQALALDERRASFQPAVWEKREGNTSNLIQVWFPGVHANIGGGYDDQELSNITLAWMMAMLAPLLDLNLEYITTQERENGDYYESKGQAPRPWSFGKIYNSATSYFALGGSINRTPGEYTRTNPRTGEATNRPLRDTNEFVHPAVRARVVLRGPGYGGKGVYEPRALRPWRLREDGAKQGMPTPWFWEDADGVRLPEPPLRNVEKMLLRMSPDVRDYVLDPPRARPAQGRGGGGRGGGRGNGGGNDRGNDRGNGRGNDRGDDQGDDRGDNGRRRSRRYS